MKIFIKIALLSALVLLLSNCYSSTTYPSPVDEAYPSPVENNIHKQHYTAIESAATATNFAKDWKKDAILYALFPSSQMSQNLGLPGISDGWFFMFKVPGSPIEFYVQVLNGKITGSTKAQPILEEQIPYKYKSIKLDQIVIDSNDAIQILFENEILENSDSDINLDYRLIHLENQINPTWTIFLIKDNELNPLIHLDAITGSKVRDPFITQQ